jgi:integrase
MARSTKTTHGRWRASIDLGYTPGSRRKRKQFSGKTRKEVADKLKRALKDQEAGMELASENQTIQGFMTRWLDTAVAPVRKPTTTASYRQVVRLYIVPKIGKVRLDKLNAEQVQTMLNALQLDGLAPRTLQYIRAVLRTALAQAVKWGYVARNVAEPTDVPQVMKYQIAPLSIEQAKKLLAAVAGHRLETLYRIALGLGLRRGEVLGLRWSDVDLEGRVLRITGQVQTIKGKTMRTDSPKSQAGVRAIPLPHSLSMRSDAIGSFSSRSEASSASHGKTTTSYSRRTEARRSSHATLSGTSRRRFCQQACR